MTMLLFEGSCCELFGGRVLCNSLDIAQDCPTLFLPQHLNHSLSWCRNRSSKTQLAVKIQYSSHQHAENGFSSSTKTTCKPLYRVPPLHRLLSAFLIGFPAWTGSSGYVSCAKVAVRRQLAGVWSTRPMVVATYFFCRRVVAPWPHHSHHRHHGLPHHGVGIVLPAVLERKQLIGTIQAPDSLFVPACGCTLHIPSKQTKHPHDKCRVEATVHVQPSHYEVTKGQTRGNQCGTIQQQGEVELLD